MMLLQGLASKVVAARRIIFLSARQAAILDAVGPFGRRAQALFAVGFAPTGTFRQSVLA